MKSMRCRAAFISDIHLGTPDCQAGLLLDFLEQLQCQRLYLVGDIIDLEALDRRPWWHPDHGRVLASLLRLAAAGTRLIYIPGNHDASLRALAGAEIGNWLGIYRETIHDCADGRRFRVSHGDEFDDAHLDSDWKLLLGERLHRLLCLGHRLANRLRRHLGMDYRAYTVTLKSRIPAVQRYMQQYAERILADTRARGLDGHIGGHIHLGQVTTRDGICLLNDGDWVEHCTALLEYEDGRFELHPWGRRSTDMPPQTDTLAPPAGHSGPAPLNPASLASISGR
ncbi:UDP-2,3-diacylglucosamine diphosphatase [Frateuria aurantia]